MQTIFWTMEDVAAKALEFYENGIRQAVEHGDNIGKMIVIDAETGEYGIDSTGVETALKLKKKIQWLDYLQSVLVMMSQQILVAQWSGLFSNARASGGW